VFHKLRSQAIEPFNGLFKNVFEWRVKRPIKLTFRTPRMAIHVFSQGGILRTHSYPQPWYVGIA
jgi:hypothetical protein